ncbi:uncharacterized protein JCM10292_002107 [Rhodotorula paludigena]|uniref:uncharacterized protein n=1 Tax=Rhodotorula paludigena TaxID=86838 RepID=UPI00317E0E29
MRLPASLVKRIASEIAHSDPNPLDSSAFREIPRLSLVCKAWLDPMRQGLLHNPYLVLGPPPSALLKRLKRANEHNVPARFFEGQIQVGGLRQSAQARKTYPHLRAACAKVASLVTHSPTASSVLFEMVEAPLPYVQLRTLTCSVDAGTNDVFVIVERLAQLPLLEDLTICVRDKSGDLKLAHSAHESDAKLELAQFQLVIDDPAAEFETLLLQHVARHFSFAHASRLDLAVLHACPMEVASLIRLAPRLDELVVTTSADYFPSLIDALQPVLASSLPFLRRLTLRRTCPTCSPVLLPASVVEHLVTHLPPTLQNVEAGFVVDGAAMRAFCRRVLQREGMPLLEWKGFFSPALERIARGECVSAGAAKAAAKKARREFKTKGLLERKPKPLRLTLKPEGCQGWTLKAAGCEARKVDLKTLKSVA